MSAQPNRRRRWNNVLIVATIAFIALINLPTVLQNFLSEPVTSAYPSLLNPNAELQALHFQQWSLEKNQGRWRSSVATQIAPEELAGRWQQIVGTEVDEATYQTLSPKLNQPQTIEVWYQDLEEPQRITLYQTPQFWLMSNWQQRWIAVSVDAGYLMPE
ncbi:hypothetical protein [Vibrio sp.]|uniref:hypothetical protein n=1 Tax=Vibrio sp. TaxID=678 RepID=UPI003D0A4C16